MNHKLFKWEHLKVTRLVKLDSFNAIIIEYTVILQVRNDCCWLVTELLWGFKHSQWKNMCFNFIDMNK